MSPTLKAGLLFGLASVFALLGAFALSIPVGSFLLGYGSVFALGIGAGYTAAKQGPPDQRIGRGASSGATAGGIHLVGLVIMMGILGYVLSGLPAVQTIITQAQEQVNTSNPGQQINITGGMIGGVLALSGCLLGFGGLIAMIIGGLIGGAISKGDPSLVVNNQYVPPGGAANYTMPQGTPYSIPPSAQGQLPPSAQGQSPYPGMTPGDQQPPAQYPGMTPGDQQPPTDRR